MRRTRIVQKTNISELAKEVLSRGATAALPSNLSDRWLRAIGRDIVRAQKANLEGRDNEAHTELIGPILLVAAICAHRKGDDTSQVDLSEDEIKISLEKFSTAIKDEIIGRETGVFVRRYGIDSFA